MDRKGVGCRLKFPYHNNNHQSAVAVTSVAHWVATIGSDSSVCVPTMIATKSNHTQIYGTSRVVGGVLSLVWLKIVRKHRLSGRVLLCCAAHIPEHHFNSKNIFIPKRTHDGNNAVFCEVLCGVVVSVRRRLFHSDESEHGDVHKWWQLLCV